MTIPHLSIECERVRQLKPATRNDSKRQKGSRRPVDTVGIEPGQALYKERGHVRGRRKLSGDEIDDRGRYDAQAEEATTVASLAFFIIAGIGMTVAGFVLVDVFAADAVVTIVGQAVRRRWIGAEGENGGRRHQARRVKRDKQACRAPTPLTG